MVNGTSHAQSKLFGLRDDQSARVHSNGGCGRSRKHFALFPPKSTRSSHGHAPTLTGQCCTLTCHGEQYVIALELVPDMLPDICTYEPPYILRDIHGLRRKLHQLEAGMSYTVMPATPKERRTALARPAPMPPPPCIEAPTVQGKAETWAPHSVPAVHGTETAFNETSAGAVKTERSVKGEAGGFADDTATAAPTPELPERSEALHPQEAPKAAKRRRVDGCAGPADAACAAPPDAADGDEVEECTQDMTYAEAQALLEERDARLARAVRCLPPHLRDQLQAFVAGYERAYAPDARPPLSSAREFEDLIALLNGGGIPEHLRDPAAVLGTLRRLPPPPGPDAARAFPPSATMERWKEGANAMLRLSCLAVACLTAHPLSRRMVLYYGHTDGGAAERLAQYLADHPGRLDVFEAMLRATLYDDGDAAAAAGWAEEAPVEDLRRQTAALEASLARLRAARAGLDGRPPPLLRRQYEVSRKQLHSNDSRDVELCVGASGLAHGGMGCQVLGAADRKAPLGWYTGEVIHSERGHASSYSLLLSAKHREYIDATRLRCPVSMINTLTRADALLKGAKGRRLFKHNCKFSGRGDRVRGVPVMASQAIVNEELFTPYGHSFQLGRTTQIRTRAIVPPFLPDVRSALCAPDAEDQGQG